MAFPLSTATIVIEHKIKKCQERRNQTRRIKVSQEDGQLWSCGPISVFVLYFAQMTWHVSFKDLRKYIFSLSDMTIIAQKIAIPCRRDQGNGLKAPSASVLHSVHINPNSTASSGIFSIWATFGIFWGRTPISKIPFWILIRKSSLSNFIVVSISCC